jgi:hypothetical protein
MDAKHQKQSCSCYILCPIYGLRSHCEIWLVILAVCKLAMCKFLDRGLEVVLILISSLFIMNFNFKNLRVILYLCL